MDLTHRALRWSTETFRIFGRDPERFLPAYESFLEAVHPEDVEAVRTAGETAQSTGGRYHIEHRVVRPDGSQRFVVEQAELVRDAAGRPAKMVGTVQDITERKLIEHALQVSEERLRLAVEGAEIGTWHWEIATGRLAWSEQCYRIFGVTPGQELSYDSFLQLLHPEERKRANRAVRLALDNPRRIPRAHRAPAVSLRRWDS